MNYPNNDTDYLFYLQKASCWNEALPIGNGRLGAMLYSDPEEETVSLNLDELWSGFPRYSTHADMREDLRDASEKALAGHCAEATEIIRSMLSGSGVQGYMPFGHLHVRFGEGTIANYSRSLSLQDAILSSSYQKNGAWVETEAFASYPAGAVFYSVRSDQPISFSLTFSSELHHSIRTEKGFLILDGECPLRSPKALKNLADLDTLYSENPEERGILYRGGICVRTNGKKTLLPDAVLVENATETVVVFTAESSFNGWSKKPYAEGKEYRNAVTDRLTALSSLPYEEAKKAHIADYASFYSRTRFDLMHEDLSRVPTDERLARFAEDGNRGLLVLLWNYGRYLAVSASREGSLPMNLQGIWNADIAPAWNSNYTTNINLQMNYWPILPCDLTELNEPLERRMRELSVAGEHTAATAFGARGFVAMYNSDLWAKTFLSDGNPRWGYWPMGAGWLCRHLYDRYLYTADRDFLADTAYPIMKKASLFFLDMLTEDPDGYLVMSPSTSPENEFIENGVVCSVSYTATMTMSILRDLFTNVLRSAEILGEKDSFTKEVEKALPRLLPTRIGKDGRILEWYREETENDPRHRHVSHLYGLHPAHEITPEKTPELAEAARRTLEARGDGGTGWSLAWKVNFYARLRDGEKALCLLRRFVNPVAPSRTDPGGMGGFYPNLFDAHPPFQIDGNFGIVSGINEMLVQTDGDNTYLLPALPSSWQDGFLRGIRVPGGAKIDMEWKEGELVSLCVHGSPLGSLFYRGQKIGKESQPKV